MSSVLALSIALLAQLPLPNRAEFQGSRPTVLEADNLVYEPSSELLIATGHAALHTGELVIRADELTYDQAHDKATARGNVMFVSGPVAAVADAAFVDVRTLETTVQRGLFMTKKGVTPETLALAKTPDELKSAGKTVTVITGSHIKKRGPDQYEVDGLAFTPCDCDPIHPSWKITAKSADVKVNDRAILHWPVIYVRDVPVFALPWMYLPLEDRKTGLLFPHPGGTTQNGFSIDQPVFFTLGPSYDLTLTPGYYWGGPDTPYSDGTVRDQQPFGVRGPRLETEFRYAPKLGTSGRMTLGGLYDFKKMRDPVDPNAFDADPYDSASSRRLIGNRQRGLRGEGSWLHVQELGSGWFGRVEASAVSDGYYPKDLNADVLQRENQYLRSSGTVFHRGDDTYAGAEVVLRQDLRYGYSLFGNDHRYGDSDAPLSRGPNTFQKLPTLRYAVLEKPLWGPVVGGLSLDYTRLSPLVSLFGDEGSNGVFDPYKFNVQRTPATLGAYAGTTYFDRFQGDGRFEPGEREARDRLDLHPKLSALLPLGEVLELEPFVAYRQDLYATELTRQTFTRGYPLAGFNLQSELARTFGATQEIRHSVTPQVKFAYVPRTFGPVFNPYDETDMAVSSGRLAQAVVAVNQRVFVRSGPVARQLARLDLGQDVDVYGRSLRDSFARFGMSLGPFNFDAIGRYNFPERRATQGTLSVAFNSGLGAAAYARFDHLVTDGSDLLRGGMDELFGAPSGLPECETLRQSLPEGATEVSLGIPCREAAEQLVLGGRYQFKSGLGLVYEALIQTLKTFAPAAPGIAPEPKINRIAQQTVGVSFAPACDCWRVELHALFPALTPPGYQLKFPNIGFSLNIARFGSFGAGH